jgi:transcriptional regulator with XRE-family HTH domain
MHNEKIFKYRLKEAMSVKKITYPKAAERLGVSLQTVSNWCNLKEDDATSIPSDFMLKLSFYLKTNVRDLYNPSYYDILKKECK